MTEDTQNLVERIRAYCKAHKMAPTTFGNRAVNDGKLVSRLEAGRTVTLSTLAKIERVLAGKPEDSAGSPAE